jgi:DNA-binding transcriptional LysR family regulator
MRHWLNGPPIEVLARFCDLYRTIAAENDRGIAISLQEVARRMRVSAGALSAMLKELEEYYGLEIGALIGRKDTGGARLTENSHQLYKRAAQCIERHDALRVWSHPLQSSVFRIGAPMIVNAFVIPEILRRYPRNWDPTIDIDYRDQETFLGRISHLRLESYSMVIDVMGNHDFTGICSERLKGVKSVPWLIIPRSRNAGGKDSQDLFRELRGDKTGKSKGLQRSLEISELGSYPLALSDNPEIQARLPEPDRSKGYRIITNTTMNVIRLVLQGGCVGIAYAWESLKNLWMVRYPNLEALPLKSDTKNPLPEYEYGVYLRDKQKLHAHEEEFLRVLRRYAQDNFVQTLPD